MELKVVQFLFTEKKLMLLENQTILITGGSSGIGLELAIRLSLHNTVIICGRSEEKLIEAKKLIPKAFTFQCDIGVAVDRLNLFNYLQSDHPSLSILVNNAAIVHKTNFLTDEKIVEKAEDEIAVNLVAPIALTKLLLSRKFPAAAIVNITTGLVFAPRAVYPIYNATKAALHSFTQVLRLQLKHTRVAVIEVLMPVVRTPWHKGEVPKVAVSPEIAVSEMLLEWQRGKTEIKIGKVKMLWIVARLWPALAFRIINRVE